ncbi:MAG: Gfo/Idh/MocA family oxidoreductase [Candidatus Aminicenantales bacterium]
MKNFALIGAAGYIAPRHMKAIKETGNVLIAALDRSDSVGVLDQYFPKTSFFTEFERFDRHAEKLKMKGERERIHYVSIASPNYLHDAHIRFSLRIGADAICEKPLVLNPWNIDALKAIEKETGRRILTILQIRYHPSILALKEKTASAAHSKKWDIDLTYVTARGPWYFYSWKGDVKKSGGIATNIGIHFFDVLQWIFGPAQKNVVHMLDEDRAAGFLELQNARVRWFLSLRFDDLPAAVLAGGKRTFRSLRVSGEEFEFSDGFADLHTATYKKILGGKGFGLDEARPSVEIVSDIRNARPIGLKGDYHPLARKK